MMGLLARAIFMMIQTIATAGSFVLSENRTDCLLIYGFTEASQAAYVPLENAARLQVFGASQFIQRVELQFR
jgi:hypothetical protein